MYDDQQDRPPWLRDLRPRKEVEATAATGAVVRYQPDRVPGVPAASLDTETEPRRGFNRRHVLLLAFLLWTNVLVLGCLCLLGTQRIVP